MKKILKRTKREIVTKVVKEMFKRAVFITLLVGGICTQEIKANSDKYQFIPVSDAKIHSLGRIEKSDPKEYKFDYTGVQFKMNFKGSAVGVRFKGGRDNYFNIFIDGKEVQRVRSVNDTTVYITNLDKKSNHNIVFYKITENLKGDVSSFFGFFVDGKVLENNLAKERKMLFIGNSITVGFGVEAKEVEDKFTPETENNYKSYASVLARYFNADYHIVAHSGRGVVRNYGDSAKIGNGEAVMGELFERTLDCSKDIRWNHKEFMPNVVVINLGTNDYSSLLFAPDKAYFIDKYRTLLSKIRTEYGEEIPILCVAGPMADEPLFSIVKEAVDGYKVLNPNSKVAFIGVPARILNRDDMGCWHPNTKGQIKSAKTIAPTLESITGWEYDISK